jgi:hypothetical protein
MRRERRNDEQPIHPPVRTNNENNLVEEEKDEGYAEKYRRNTLLQEENNSMHLTQDDYEYSLNTRKQTPKGESNKEILSSVQYRMFVDALQDEMHMKYDLRPRKKDIQSGWPTPT